MTIDHSAAIQELDVARFNRIFINNEWRECAGTVPVIDPSTELQSGAIGNATAEDVDDAVVAAREGFRVWRKMSTNKRRACLLKMAALIKKHEKEFARLESLNMGMPLQAAESFVVKACYRNLEYFASWMDKIYGEVVPMSGQSEGHFNYTKREPYGVISVIIPWNTPLLFIGSKVGPALATGNSVILKPSEVASWTSLRFAELVQEAGFPAGVINVITGDAGTGKALCGHTGIDKITFTGGGETAKHVLAASAHNLKPVSLELGGKSPNIIMKDANLGKASMGAALGCFALTGQACAASSRVFIQEEAYDEMVKRIAGVAKNLVIGDPLDKASILGPLSSAGQYDRVMGYIEQGKSSGAKLTYGGGKIGSIGYFVEPTIFQGADPASPMAREEIFGPVMNIWPFKKLDDVLEQANDTEYGLAAGIWTSDINNVHKAANALEAGIIWANSWAKIPNATPFGGFKQSGIGREGGTNVLEEFTQVKSVYIELR